MKLIEGNVSAYLSQWDGRSLRDALVDRMDIPSATVIAHLPRLDSWLLSDVLVKRLDITPAMMAEHLSRLNGGPLIEVLVWRNDIAPDIAATHLPRVCEDDRTRYALTVAGLRSRDWDAIPLGTVVLHCYHDRLAARLYCSASERVKYICARKPLSQLELRLRLFRPASAAFAAAYQHKNMAEVKRLHNVECPDCPWNGETIFPKEE